MTAPAEASPADLLVALGVQIEPDLLTRALTHRSYAYEHGGLPTNERLEFLGDAVLGLVVTDSLFRRFPDVSEGRLAKLRAAVVNSRALAQVGRRLSLGAHLRLGRGEETTGGRDKPSILADTVEAVIGAVFVEHGFPTAAELVHRLFDPVIVDAAERGAGLDWKTSLQELAADAGLGAPVYVLDQDGPDHARTFAARVVIGQEECGKGTGRSKKQAEQQAAEEAWRLLRDRLGPREADLAQAGRRGTGA